MPILNDITVTDARRAACAAAPCAPMLRSKMDMPMPMQRLAVIDPGLDQPDLLLKGLAPDAVGFVLDGTQDALSQIADAVQRMGQVEELHILSHGRPGAVQLGASDLSLETLSAKDEALGRLGAALDGAQVVLYGCETGAGDAGAAFIAALSQRLDAPVSASATRTGATDKGGDWIIDRGAPIGSLAVSQAVQAAWNGVMANIFGSSASGTEIINGTAQTDFIVPYPNVGSVNPDNPGTDIITTGAGSDFVITVITDISDGDVITDFDPFSGGGDEFDTFVLEFDTITNFSQEIVANGDGGFDTLLTVTFGEFTRTQRFEDVAGTFEIYFDPSSFISGTFFRLAAAADPIAEDDAFTLKSTETQNGNLLDNDSLPGDGTLTVSAVQGGSVGIPFNLTSGAQLLVNADGSFLFNPLNVYDSVPQGQTVDETITYTASDGQGGTDTATLTFTVVSGNRTPDATDDVLTTPEETDLSGNLLTDDNGNGVDGDLDGDPITLTQVNGSAVNVGSEITLTNGSTITVQSNGGFNFTPLAGFVGTETFTYTLDDGDNGTDTATVSIIVTEVNDPPSAQDDAFGGNEDNTVIGNLLADNGNGADSDPENDTLTVIDNTGATSGGVSIQADGGFTYTPNDNFFGTDSFTYTVSDGRGGTDTATVSINIASVADAPIAQDDIYQLGRELILIDNLFADNGNGTDSDADGDSFTIVEVNGEIGNVGSEFALDSGVLLTVSSDGNFEFNPNGVYDQVDVLPLDETFTYTISDGSQTDTATVTITIITESAPPVAQDDTINVLNNNLSTSSVFADNGNGADTDPDGGTLRVIRLNGEASDVGEQQVLPSGALLTVNLSGTVSFDPNGQYDNLIEGQTAIETFTYTLSDSQGGTDTATATIIIGGTNATPTAGDDPGGDEPGFATDKDEAFVTANVLLNDAPATGETDLTIVGLNFLGTQGLVSSNGDGTFNYDPNGQFADLGLGETATDIFRYTITDSSGQIDTAEVTITIVGGNTDPVAVADPDGDPADFTTDADAVLVTGNVLDNDSDFDDDPLSVAALDDNETLGTVQDLGDGTFSYDPNGQFADLADGETATDSFSYTVSDGLDGTDTATVTITIIGVNEAPIALGDSDAPGDDPAFTTTADTSFITGDVLDNDVDPDSGDVLSVIGIDTSQTQGLVTNNGDGTFVYNPNGQFTDLAVGQTATDSFVYTLSDGNGGTDTASVTITIEGSNDAPQAVNDLFTTNASGIATGNLLADNGLGGDSDVDGDSLLAFLDTQPVNGSVQVASDGSFTYTADQGFSGQDSFTYTIDDGNGGIDTGTVTMNVFVQSTMVAINDPVSATFEGSGTDGAQGFTLTRSGLLESTVTIDYIVVGSGANPAASDDFAGGGSGLPTGSVTFAPGEQTATIFIQTVGDYFSEQDETYSVFLASATSSAGLVFLTDAAAQGTILNDDGAVESITQGDEGNNNLKGGIQDDLLDGLAGRDRLKGREGNDRLFGGDDDDRIDGGFGNDVMLGGTGDDTIRGRDGNDVLLGGDGDDRLDGEAGNDVIEGEGGNDNIDAGIGNDIIDGGDGNDIIDAGAGNDTVEGGAGNDEIEGDDGNDDLSGGVGIDIIEGGDGNDVLNGDSGDDTLDGGDGSDDMFGGAGNDMLDGGDGNDVLDGGTGNDTLDAGDGDNQLFGGDGSDTLIAGRGNDLLDGGSGGDILEADRGNDTLLGFDGNDTLDAGRGDDTLDGGAGDDTMTGGKGDDLFIFGLGDGIGRITDFQRGKDEDRLDLTDFAGLTFDDFVARAEEEGKGVRIAFDTGEVLIIENLRLKDLDDGDFDDGSILFA